MTKSLCIFAFLRSTLSLDLLDHLTNYIQFTYSSKNLLDSKKNLGVKNYIIGFSQRYLSICHPFRKLLSPRALSLIDFCCFSVLSTTLVISTELCGES